MAPGKEIVIVACPKDKLEVKFFLFPSPVIAKEGKLPLLSTPENKRRQKFKHYMYNA